MDLITLVIYLAIIGVLLYVFNNYVTMIDAKIKQIINVVVVVAVVIWLVTLFVPLPHIPVGRR